MQNLKKIILFIITAIGVTLFIKNPNKNSNNISKKLIIGTAGGYAPFVSINAQGDYEGFDIDVAKEVAQKMNYDLEIKDFGSMPALFIALEQKKVDAIIWAISITKERLDKVTMIRYQGDDTKSYPLLFWNNIPKGATNMQELGNATICVETGSCQETALNRYDNVKKLSVNHVDDALLNIQYAKADGAIVEPAIAQKFQQKYPQIKVLNLGLEPEDQIQGIGIAVKKDNAILSQQIQKAIKDLQDQGIISKLEKKWGITA